MILSIHSLNMNYLFIINWCRWFGWSLSWLICSVHRWWNIVAVPSSMRRWRFRSSSWTLGWGVWWCWFLAGFFSSFRSLSPFQCIVTKYGISKKFLIDLFISFNSLYVVLLGKIDEGEPYQKEKPFTNSKTLEIIPISWDSYTINILKCRPKCHYWLLGKEKKNLKFNLIEPLKYDKNLLQFVKLVVADRLIKQCRSQNLIKNLV